MSARIKIKRFEVTPECPAFMSIWVQDGPAIVTGHVYIGERSGLGGFIVGMSNESFGKYRTVMGQMSDRDAETFLRYVLGPLDFARPAMQVVA